MKILCVFGKNRPGGPRAGEGFEYTAFMPTLKRLGHEVVHFDSWNRKAFRDYAELNDRLLETVELERPDILLSVQINYELWLETLRIIRARGDVATISWTTDDSWKFREVSRFIGSAYHAITTTYDYIISLYHASGISNVLLTQWAANAEWLHEPLPACRCKYPVSFVGSAHGSRKNDIQRLQSMGIEVRCFGNDWPWGPVAVQEIPRIMRESVISLNFANTRWIGRNRRQIKARVFEVPGAGGFLLTEYAQGLERYYILGQEIVVFDGMDEMAEKIRYYLDHPNERDEIARRGFERTRQEHLYDFRLKEVLDFALSAKAKWMKMHPVEAIPRIEAACATHRLILPLRVLRYLLCAFCIIIWGDVRGPRAARRLVYELSWRLAGAHTYSAAGWPGRMFYKES